MKMILVSLMALSGASAYADEVVLCRSSAGYEPKAQLIYSVGQDGSVKALKASLGGLDLPVQDPIRVEDRLQFSTGRQTFMVNPSTATFTVEHFFQEIMVAGKCVLIGEQGEE